MLLTMSKSAFGATPRLPPAVLATWVPWPFVSFSVHLEAVPARAAVMSSRVQSVPKPKAGASYVVPALSIAGVPLPTVS